MNGGEAVCRPINIPPSPSFPSTTLWCFKAPSSTKPYVILTSYASLQPWKTARVKKGTVTLLKPMHLEGKPRKRLLGNRKWSLFVAGEMVLLPLPDVPWCGV